MEEARLRLSTADEDSVRNVCHEFSQCPSTIDGAFVTSCSPPGSIARQQGDTSSSVGSKFHNNLIRPVFFPCLLPSGDHNKLLFDTLLRWHASACYQRNHWMSRAAECQNRLIKSVRVSAWLIKLPTTALAFWTGVCRMRLVIRLARGETRCLQN